MIKKIIFTSNNDSLLVKEQSITFSPKTNVIIGPKGGGKSTLFDLVASLEKNQITKGTIDALESFGLSFSRALKFNGEEISSNALAKISNKDKKEQFEKRNDVIFQDDPIKKNLHNFSDIDKEKYRFAKDSLEDNKEVEALIKSIKLFHSGMEKLSEYNSAVLNWSNTFKISKSKMPKAELFIRLNYNNSDLKSSLRSDLEKLNDINQKLIDLQKYLSKVKNYQWSEFARPKALKVFLEDKSTDPELFFKNWKTFLNSEITWTKQLLNLSNIFSTSYKQELDLMKASEFEKSGLKDYEIKALNHFQSLANLAMSQRKLFDKLLSKEVTISFSKKSDGLSFLAFELSGQITLSESDIYELLKVVLITPGRGASDVSKWMDSAVKKGVKDFKVDKILSLLGRILKEKVVVLANGKDYATMSPGQKSIYGIKYKFNSSNNKSLFLDQPEDNLDNYTIATEVLPMIKNHKQQIFVVTHNANIGILSNPEQVIVANISNTQKGVAYKQGQVVKNRELESDSAHYLEGGDEYLSNRYQKIIGNKEKKWN